VSRAAVRTETLGAWLIKVRGAEPETVEHLRDGLSQMRSRCVRPSYRTRLVASGDLVLLWVSGSHTAHPAGLYGHGHATGRVAGDRFPLEALPLGEPLLRAALVAHPVLVDLEVLRMPAGSNPSYVTPEQFAALADLRPELAGRGS
jgi:hypothetical protein